MQRYHTRALTVSLLALLAACSLLALSRTGGARALLSGAPSHAASALGLPLQTAWTQIGETGGVAVHALAFDPASTDCLLAGTYFEGLFRTTDGGDNWSNPLSASTGAIAFDIDSPGTVYAGTWHAGAYKSPDCGETWSPITTSLAANDVYALLVDPYALDTVYAGTEMGIFKTTNGGASWQGASTGFPGGNVYALASVDGTLLAGTDLGAFVSTDGAASWSPANTGLSANQVFALTAPLGAVYAAADQGVVYAATDQGVFRSENSGGSWTATGSGLPVGPVHTIIAGSSDPDVVVAGTGQGVYASEGGGASWTALNAGLSGATLEARALLLDETTSPWTIYAGTGSGVWVRSLPELPTPTPTATHTPTATPTATATPEHTYVYLPVVLRSYPPGIHGKVTYNDTGAAGIELRLRYYDGASWSTAATTHTGAQGAYNFTGLPSLGAGQTYYVRYGANTTDDRYVYNWYGPDITAYTAGQTIAGGDFDIANVVLLSPEHGATLSLPATFTWQMRGIATDTYRWVLFDPSGDDSWWTADRLTAGSFQLTGLPDGASYGYQYGWEVYVYNGPDSYGMSRYSHAVTFED